MPRSFGKVNVAIWNDPEFRDLPPAAQHLYLLLWTSPDLSFCGVHDWRPGRLTKLSRGFTEEHTRTVAACLQARHFLVVDEGTEEVLVRSWARFDETLKQPRLAVSYASAYAATYSPVLRQVLAHEAEKMRRLWPELVCWKDERVSQILDHPAVSAKDLPTPDDPFGDGFGDGLDHGFALGLAQATTNVWGSVCPPPTTTPTTTTNNSHHERGDERGEESDFEDWYAAYPRKRGRGQALKAYRAARKKVSASVLLEAVKAQTRILTARGEEFAPYPSTWLNGERWADELGQAAGDDGWGWDTLPAAPPEIADDPARYAEWLEQARRA